MKGRRAPRGKNPQACGFFACSGGLGVCRISSQVAGFVDSASGKRLVFGPSSVWFVRLGARLPPLPRRLHVNLFHYGPERTIKGAARHCAAARPLNRALSAETSAAGG